MNTPTRQQAAQQLKSIRKQILAQYGFMNKPEAWCRLADLYNVPIGSGDFIQWVISIQNQPKCCDNSNKTDKSDN